ncbi:MAG: M48 family metalloprotease [Pseudomonadota bacterium]
MIARKVLTTFSVFAFVLVTLLPAEAQRGRGRGIPLIRDAEIEALINDYTRPILKAAGLRRSAIEIYLVNDNTFNAFVAGRRMFIHAGAILLSETPNEIIGVIAHEIGHVVGGHHQRLAQQVRRANLVAGFATLLGAGVAVAGGLAGNSQVTGAGAGVAAGGQYQAITGLLRYQRAEERAADLAATRFLSKTGQSGKGMLATFQRFAENLSIQGGRVNPYLQSHPMPRERIQNLSTIVKKSKFYNRMDPKQLQERHDLARAKIAAYLGSRRQAVAILNSKKVSPLARQYGQAIVTHLYGSPRRAVPQINALIKKRPKYAYFHEMKGEILLRSGKPKQAVAPFRRAVRLDKTGAGFLRVELGHALLESGGRKNTREAVKHLKRGLASDPNAVVGYRYLAGALGELGDVSGALLATAEGYFRSGHRKEAKQFAHRAQKNLKRGSPGWLRAQDIITYK